MIQELHPCEETVCEVQYKKGGHLNLCCVQNWMLNAMEKVREWYRALVVMQYREKTGNNWEIWKMAFHAYDKLLKCSVSKLGAVLEENGLSVSLGSLNCTTFSPLNFCTVGLYGYWKVQKSEWSHFRSQKWLKRGKRRGVVGLMTARGGKSCALWM